MQIFLLNTVAGDVRNEGAIGIDALEEGARVEAAMLPVEGRGTARAILELVLVAGSAGDAGAGGA